MTKIVSLFLLFGCMLGCNSSSDANRDNTKPATIDTEAALASNSNAEMALELRQIADNTDPTVAWHLNSQLAEILRKQLATKTGVERIPLRFSYAQQLLSAGNTILAIAEIQGVIEDFLSHGVALTDQTKLVYELLAIAYLRLAEEQNCTTRHNPESCIMPFQGGGIHSETEGSKEAIKIYDKILRLYPDDLQSRYLMNMAFMTLGEFPDNVPDEFLIKNMAALSKNPKIQKFKDIAIQAKADIYGISGGTSLEDFNNDGLLDILASSYGLKDQIHYLVNNGNGQFEDYTERAGLNGIVSGLNTLQADYNNDGFVDVLILRGAWLGVVGQHPNSLLRNNGDNTFTDVTRASGIYSKSPTQAAVWRDFDLDGWVDIFIGNESGKRQKQACEYFHNNGDGTFTEQALTAGLNFEAYVKGVSSGDVNNDGWPDLYISVITGPNYLLLNKGIGNDGVVHFQDITTLSGTSKPIFSFPCWFWDYDQDGWDDIFASSYDLKGFENMTAEIAAELMGSEFSSELPKAYRNNGDNTFSDVTAELNLDKLMFGMGSNFGDLNNDGFDDFYIGNGAPDFRMIIPNKMFLNLDGNTFEEVTYDGGFAHVQKGHAVSFGDLDNDGDQDIYCVMGGAVEGDKYHNILFENPGSANNWITLKPVGTRSNRMAIGAKVHVYGKDQKGTSLVRRQTVSTGGSFGGSSLQCEIGLSNMNNIDSIVVQWPYRNQPKNVYTNVEVNGTYTILEGSNKATQESPKTFSFK